jgi:glycosyltransferase involved in cell wall biosynthesis
VKLGIVYHMPFWTAADGTLWELEGSFARYVDSLAPYFDEISLCVPVFADPQPSGTRVHSPNVRLAPLPFFDGPKAFYRSLPGMLRRIGRWVRRIDVLHCRVPTPAAFPAYAFARAMRKPIFLLVVGDLGALRPTLPYVGARRAAWGLYTSVEEFLLGRMTRGSLTFANGRALAEKHARAGVPAIETKTTTIAAADVASREDTCLGSTIRMLTVSRIDPRKGLRCLPEAVALLRAAGRDVRLDIVGPVVGRPGEQERAAVLEDARRRGVSEFVRCLGPVPLQALLPRYAEYDLFVLPTLPGEGIPRVLLEAMASGLPLITTAVSGIPSLVSNERNGLLIDRADAEAVARAVGRLIDDGTLRRALIRNGYDTARGLTLDTQAARMVAEVASRLGIALRPRMAAAS